VLVSAGWWLAAVQLTPAADRPYIGGSQDNSEFNLIFGYNGFGRLTGSESGSVGGGRSGTSMWGPTGWSRMFNSTFGTQASWLIPAALVALVAVLWLTRRAPRQDRTRAAFILWGGWLIVTAAVFSFGQGIIHPYYTVALAPAIGALVGMGAVELWRRRHQWFARAALAGATALTAWWAYALLDRTPGWFPWLRFTVLAAGIVVALGILAAPLVGRSTRRAVALVGIGVALAGPLAFTVDTVAISHSGAIPTAGPTSTAALLGGFGGAGRAGGFAGRPGFTQGTRPGGGRFTPPAGVGAGAPPSFAPGSARGRALGGGGGGGAGGLLNASAPSATLVKTLQADSSSYTWVAAAVGANTAAGYQLGTGDPVMAIGGFNGTDPDPSLATFKKLVAEGKVHYFIAGGGFGGGLGARFGGGFAAFGGGSTTAKRAATVATPQESEDSSAITSWVESHYTAKVVGGVTLYDLSPSSD
jgi:4-amino-4-deoxy-L-arabinose transferase-like glycosyltransferase